jgi:hypothetical protein
MRGVLIRLVSVLAAAGGLIVAGQSTTYGDTVCQQTNPATGLGLTRFDGQGRSGVVWLPVRR